MTPTFNDKLIAYFTLFSGLAISAIAEYYSIMGLMAIYPTAIIPIVIMGIVLGTGKISGTVWLKQNWEWSPMFLKVYVLPAIVVLMLITSLGVFGFLSKAHSDQSLVSGDVLSKVAVYDEKIKTEKENIEANRKALKQMDEGVDQVLGRSTDEKGADKAVAMRRSQQKERSRLQAEILQSQKSIAELNDARAPIAAEVRKVEAEVGPIKYIAHLLYGENPDANILEKAVIWVTVLIVIVLDPLAVVLLLASQYSFQRFRKLEEEDDKEEALEQWFIDAKARARQLDEEAKLAEGDSPQEPTNVVGVGTTVTEPETPVPVEQWNDWIAKAEKAIEDEKKQASSIEYQILEDVDEPEVELTMAEKHPYLNQPFVHFEGLEPMVAKKEWKGIEHTPLSEDLDEPEEELVTEEPKILAMGVDIVERPGDYVTPPIDFNNVHPDKEFVKIDGVKMHVDEARAMYDKPSFTEVIEPEIKFGSYVQNEEQGADTKWNRVISEAEYREKAQEKLKHDHKDNTDNAS